MAGFSRKIDDQREMQQKPGTPAKGKMEPPIQIVMEPEDPSLQEVIPVKSIKPVEGTSEKTSSQVPPLKIVMDDSELS